MFAAESLVFAVTARARNKPLRNQVVRHEIDTEGGQADSTEEPSRSSSPPNSPQSIASPGSLRFVLQPRMELEAKNTLLDVMTAEYSLILGQVDLKDLYNLSLASRAYHSVMQTAFKDVVGHICREKGYLMKPYYFDYPYLVHCYQKCSKMAKNFDPDLTGRFLFTSPEMVSSALSENYLVATYSTPKTLTVYSLLTKKSTKVGQITKHQWDDIQYVHAMSVRGDKFLLTVCLWESIEFVLFDPLDFSCELITEAEIEAEKFLVLPLVSPFLGSGVYGFGLLIDNEDLFFIEASSSKSEWTIEATPIACFEEDDHVVQNMTIIFSGKKHYQRFFVQGKNLTENGKDIGVIIDGEEIVPVPRPKEAAGDAMGIASAFVEHQGTDHLILSYLKTGTYTYRVNKNKQNISTGVDLLQSVPEVYTSFTPVLPDPSNPHPTLVAGTAEGASVHVMDPFTSADGSAPYSLTTKSTASPLSKPSRQERRFYPWHYYWWGDYHWGSYYYHYGPWYRAYHEGIPRRVVTTSIAFGQYVFIMVDHFLGLFDAGSSQFVWQSPPVAMKQQGDIMVSPEGWTAAVISEEFMVFK